MSAGRRMQPESSPIKPSLSVWSPFRHKPFTVIWLATLVANIGSWMYSAACGWLSVRLESSGVGCVTCDSRDVA
jgi:hypothetical protein